MGDCEKRKIAYYGKYILEVRPNVQTMRSLTGNAAVAGCPDRGRVSPPDSKDLLKQNFLGKMHEEIPCADKQIH